MGEGMYGVVCVITVLVIGVYGFVLNRRMKRRRVAFHRAGYRSLKRGEARQILTTLRIMSRFEFTLLYWGRVYSRASVNGQELVSDMLVSAGTGRYTGFSYVTVLGYVGDLGGLPDFLIRSRALLETRLELRGGCPLKGEWYAWGDFAPHHNLEALVDRFEVFAKGAVLRKKGDVLSFYFRGEYLHERRVLDLLPEWRRFCCDFRHLVRAAGG